MPGNITGLTNVDGLRSLFRESSPQLHHSFAVPNLTRRLVQKVTQRILAPQVAAASDHTASKIHGEIYPRLMTERVHASVGCGVRAAQVYEAFTERVVEVDGHDGDTFWPLGEQLLGLFDQAFRFLRRAAVRCQVLDDDPEISV